MFKNLIKFEFFYQRKQRSLLIVSFILLCYGLLLGNQAYATAGLDFNSPYQISYYTSIMTLGALFVVILFSINAVLRDKSHNVESIIYSTSIKKHQFFLSRFFGVFIFGVIAFMPFFLGYYLSITFSGLDPERIGDFNIMSYIMPWLILVIPNVFVCSVIIFSISILTKNNIATYIGGVGMYIVYMIVSASLNSPLMAGSSPSTPETILMGSLLDPFGIIAFFQQTDLMLPFQKNTELLSLSGLMLWNRLLWIAIATLILGVVYKIFSFKEANQKIKKTKKTVELTSVSSTYKPVKVTINNTSDRKAFFSLVKGNLRYITRSIPFMVLMAMWVFLIFMDLNSGIYGNGDYGDSLYPSTDILIKYISAQLPLFSVMLIIFFSGELVWRSRSNDFNEIIDVTPASNSSFFMSNLISLFTLPAMLIVSSIIIALGFQITAGYTDLDLHLYLYMFYQLGISLVFYAILAVFVQSIVSNKYLGMIVIGIVIFLFGSNSGYIGIHHPMLRLGIIPKLGYTNMNGFSTMVKAFNDFSMYWISLGFILILISFKLLQRGLVSSWKVKLNQLVNNWSKKQIAIISVLVLLFVASASNVYYNTKADGYKTVTEKLDVKEKYERKYSSYKDLDRLYPVDINTKVDLYPSSNGYTMEASYKMKNTSNNPIYKILVDGKDLAKLSYFSFNRGNLIDKDTILDVYLYEFDPAIKPNEVLEMNFTIARKSKIYASEKAIVANGTYIGYRDYNPRLGYNSSMEIQDNIERKKRGLPELIEEAIEESHLEAYKNGIVKATFETVISTENDQIAISTGKLIKQWKAEDRNYYHYKETKEVVPSSAYFSAEYKVKKDTYKNISIEQYYHENHDYNIDRIAESAKEALEYCISNFGDYPFDYLRIAEIPSHWGFGGFTHPGVISMVEDRLYLSDVRDISSFDLVAKRTIHEVAHQWWGHMLLPKTTQGAALFIEGFAKYTEALVLDKMYGKGFVWQLSESANYRYNRGSAYANEPEPAIYMEDGQNYLAYGKMLNVMLALNDLMGEDNVNIAMNNIIIKYGENKDVKATSLDFLDELYSIAPQYKSLIDDWFKRVIIYDLSIGDHSYKKLDNGKYEITIQVKAKRGEMQESGELKDVSINEPIRIALLTKSPNEVKSNKDFIYYKHHNINKENTELVIVVDQLPTHISVDPYITRSDKNVYDNTVEVEVK